MDSQSFVRSHQGVVIGYAFLAPLVVAAMLATVRGGVTSATAVLVLVILVVAAGATGLRAAGIVAALSAGAWFDFFLTEPYGSFKVDDRDDIEAAILLLVVGVAVSEIALWGRRQQGRASRRAGYLDGVLGTADIVADRDASPDRLVERVERQIVEILDIDACRFEPAGAVGESSTVLNRDGTVSLGGHPVDVDRHGLPTDDLIALDVRHGGVSHGRFVLTASTRLLRPSLEQRRVVVLLADQVGAALTGSSGRRG